MIDERDEQRLVKVLTELFGQSVEQARIIGTTGVFPSYLALLDDREPPLRLLAMVARQLRIVARMREALSEGLRPQDAAKRAGAPPFKAADLTESARRFTADSLGDAFTLIAETDRALKGSKRPPDVILQDAVLQLCADHR